MNKIEMLQAQLQILHKARNYLLHQQPTDVVALNQVTERIVMLSERLAALISKPSHAPLPLESVQALNDAVRLLEGSINTNSPADRILQGLAGLPGDPTTLPDD